MREHMACRVLTYWDHCPRIAYSGLKKVRNLKNISKKNFMKLNAMMLGGIVFGMSACGSAGSPSGISGTYRPMSMTCSNGASLESTFAQSFEALRELRTVTISASEITSVTKYSDTCTATTHDSITAMTSSSMTIAVGSKECTAGCSSAQCVANPANGGVFTYDYAFNNANSTLIIGVSPWGSVCGDGTGSLNVTYQRI